MSSDSQTPLQFLQLRTLAGFCQTPELFVSHARSLAANVLCPFEPVHGMTAITCGSLAIVSHPIGSTSGGTTLIRFGSSSDTNGGMRSLSVKWKSRSPPPTRLIKGMSPYPEIEIGRIQPFEGCFHRFSVVAEGLTPVINLYTQVMGFAGEFPDTSMDPEMRMRICIRDAELIAPTGDWRISFPGGMLTKSFKGPRGFADLLGGFQTLAGIPDCHWVASNDRAANTSAPDSSTSPDSLSSSIEGGFPYNGAFCSCICGQERTSWSWARLTSRCGTFAALESQTNSIEALFMFRSSYISDFATS
jgi:hypothetical protein